MVRCKICNKQIPESIGECTYCNNGIPQVYQHKINNLKGGIKENV